MSDVELIARLRSINKNYELARGVHVDIRLAADSIEKLVKERDEAWKRAAHSEKMWGEAEAKLAECEARLGKAVEALNNIDSLDPESLVSGCSRDALSGLVNLMGAKARTALAELKGESHD